MKIAVLAWGSIVWERGVLEVAADFMPNGCTCRWTMQQLNRRAKGHLGARRDATVLRWLRRRRQAERLAQTDAEALVRDRGAEGPVELMRSILLNSRSA